MNYETALCSFPDLVSKQIRTGTFISFIGSIIEKVENRK